MDVIWLGRCDACSLSLSLYIYVCGMKELKKEVRGDRKFSCVVWIGIPYLTGRRWKKKRN